MRQLAVRINHQLVGHLRENDDLWEFEYASPWRAFEQGFDLSPALPRAVALHRDGATNRPVQWYFDNLLPEEQLRTLIASEANLPASDAFSLLTHFGEESAGSLILVDVGRKVSVPQGLLPLSLPELSSRIRRLPQASLSKDAAKRMSLAGAQHKMLVVFENGQLFEPLPGTPSTHILKPNHPSSDYPATVMNEYFTMRLARAVGLDVADVQRVYVPQPVYLVTRFDRTGNTEGHEVRRRHIIDACQLLNRSRVFKYTAAQVDTLAQAIDHCRHKAASRLTLYRWILFNILVGNADNHLKNISFLVDGSGIRVAPGYDLLCTVVYDTKVFAGAKANWPHTQLAFELGDARRFSGVTRAHLTQAGKMLGLSPATATRELDRLIRVIPEQADKLLAEIVDQHESPIAPGTDTKAARAFFAGEARLLRTIRHLVISDMTLRLA